MQQRKCKLSLQLCDCLIRAVLSLSFSIGLLVSAAADIIQMVTPATRSSIKKKDYSAVKIAAQNRAASYNYELLDKYEAGLVLVGTEVKTLREGKASLRDAYADAKGGEIWLMNCHIPEYRPGGPWNHGPLRPRKLLLNRREIDKLSGQIQQKGLTLIPLKIYFRDGMAKCELALARGKKSWDRRHAEREKEDKREAREAMHRYKRH